MSLRALRTLQAIARHGSFAGAGKAVGLTQSAVSLQVKALEEEFGAPLFDRSRRLPVLTEAGRIVVARSAEVLALYDDIAAALGDERSLAGRLRVGAVQTALVGRLRHGNGQFIDVALMDSMINLLVFECQEAQFPSKDRRPLYVPMRARDGFVIVAPVNQRNFEQLK